MEAVLKRLEQSNCCAAIVLWCQRLPTPMRFNIRAKGLAANWQFVPTHRSRLGPCAGWDKTLMECLQEIIAILAMRPVRQLDQTYGYRQPCHYVKVILVTNNEEVEQVRVYGTGG